MLLKRVKGKLKSVKPILVLRKIINYYLFNNLEKHDLRYKILLNRNDKETFLSIIEGSNEYPAVFSHHMVDNYKFFEEKIQNNDRINLNEIYLGIP